MPSRVCFAAVIRVTGTSAPSIVISNPGRMGLGGVLIRTKFPPVITFAGDWVSCTKSESLWTMLRTTRLTVRRTPSAKRVGTQYGNLSNVDTGSSNPFRSIVGVISPLHSSTCFWQKAAVPSAREDGMTYLVCVPLYTDKLRARIRLKHVAGATPRLPRSIRIPVHADRSSCRQSW